MIRCGRYLRLSREDGQEESNSIQNQRQLLEQYLLEHPDMCFAGEWVDDGWSGSSFERPGFQNLLQAAFAGEIDCILVKDLSRLGREYIQTGYYLQEVFPKLGIRFIAVADHYDSARAEFMEQSLMVPVLNLMNDAYCRDISQKVRWQQRTKRSLGEYIGAFAVYGYEKDKEDVHRLVVDRQVQQIIRSIYFLRLSGMSPEKIAERLNLFGIPSPREYKKKQGSRFQSGFDRDSPAAWSALAVRRILHNEMYTGLMIQGKDTKISYKLKERVKLPREEWNCVKGAVPVLIPEWLFQCVKRVEEKRCHCHKGEVFCDVWSGMLTGDGAKYLVQKKQIEEAIVCFLYAGIYPGILPDQERWLRRLFLVLFFQQIEIKERDKSILLHAAWREGE